MKSSTLFALAILPALLCASAAAAPAAPSGAAATPAPAAMAPSAIAPVAFDKYTLPNGLEVILVENHTLPVVAVNIWYHVGPANEAPGLTGFAHLFEHMMFAATRHVPRGLADTLLESAGANDSNGSTDFDRTNYFDTVPSNQLELALWIHSDRMGYLPDVLDQTALTNQQDVVRNERRQSTENRPYGIVEEALYHLMFPKSHPYYAAVIGSHADIQNAKLKDIREFFARYYGPNNASLVIAGDIDKAAARALVAKYFGSFKRSAPVAKPAVATPAITAERRLVVADRVELPRVFMGWLTPPAFAPGDAELAVAAQILGGGKSSRLYKALVYDKQIAQDVSASQGSNALTSMFVLDATARAGHTGAELEAAIDAELQALRANGPTEKEMQRARNTIETGMLSGVEKLGGAGLANQLNLYNQYTGDPGYLVKDIERYRRVTAADVQRVVRAQLQNKARAVVTAVPGKQDLGPEVATPAPLTEKPGRAAGINADQPWRAQAPKAGPAPAIKLPQGESFKLSNGLLVIHHDNPALPLVAADLVVRAGSEANPLARSGLSGYTAQMLEEGTASRSAPQIADDIAQLGAFLGTSSAADSARISLQSLRSNFPKALEVLADLAMQPAFPAAEVERQRASRLGDLSQQRDAPEAVAALAAAATLYGDKHPYGFSELGTEASIKATTRDDLLGFWKRHYLPNNAALVVAGDIRRDELKALAENLFGKWKPAPVTAMAPAVRAGSKARLVLVDKPGAPQTALRVTNVAAERKSPDFPALQVMNAALGGLFSSRINNNLREEKGYSYGMFSQFQYRRAPGPFAIAGSVRTDVTGASVSEIFKEVKGMRERPMTAAELANAKNSQMLSLPGQFDTNRALGASLANTYIYELPLDYYSKLPAAFAGVTIADVQKVAKAYLGQDKLVVVAVGDRAKIGPQLDTLKLTPVEVRDADGVRK
ncbi:MAG: pitrilysin family protein [Massilia sp.]